MIHKAKKSLGQNFLKSETILKKVVETGEISENDIVLEIGPGKGTLTKKLLEKAKIVIAIEKDRELFSFLQEKFKSEISEKKLILIEDDILKFEADKIFSDSSQKFCNPLNYKIIANIPYNITGAILKKFLENKNQPSMMVLMVQHEVARRIVANDGKESILSISVKAYGTPKLITKVPARYFSPAPKVDSAIILIKNISKNFFTKNKIGEERFWELVRTGFAHKRKKLSSNLKKNSKIDLEKLGNKRAENLSLEDWKNLINSKNFN
ncbi:MAG TPA: 16S rRNA (adenine(1518)-N(6)/adenine(1519)-N(6))-dimethyltransferase RsmA [Candidatus Paceibacterota bacterium]|nr:16S rRNA (adenine(1518)-N(6)/adenine(1519)-N(6))-dimethyltransferase RsmA [Candidatus Paceibacterota bacterium]HPT18020.1 16S rRNA (adenine(1518)-N(6)/adenine(1519)-N(6))-dimethyltransferase RsmA [Candidatus Paceibacterota bacterium]